VLLIAVTGYGQAGDRQRSSAAGFDAHLTKPVDPATLEALLENLPLDPGRTGR
jgi:CheY-like chemotaxis protein